MLVNVHEFEVLPRPPLDTVVPVLSSTYFFRKEVRNMPWYTNPAVTCKVLNRIANRHPRTSLHELRAALDTATQMIWSKQEQYYNKLSMHSSSDVWNQQ